MPTRRCTLLPITQNVSCALYIADISGHKRVYYSVVMAGQGQGGRGRKKTTRVWGGVQPDVTSKIALQESGIPAAQMGVYCQFGFLTHLLLVVQNCMMLPRRKDLTKTVCYCPLWHIASLTVPIAPSRLSRTTSILLITALLGWVRGKSSRAAAIYKVSKQYCGSIKPALKREINPLFIPMQIAALKDKVSSHSCILLLGVVN